MELSAAGSLAVQLITAVVLLLASTASALRCVYCNLNERNECRNGSVAAQNDQLIATCLESQPYCQVTQLERLLADGTTSVLGLVRQCSAEQLFSCAERPGRPLRECVSTCARDLCNDYDDGAERALRPDLYRVAEPPAAAEPALLWWHWLLIAAAAVVLTAALVVATLRWRKRKHTLLPSKAANGDGK